MDGLFENRDFSTNYFFEFWGAPHGPQGKMFGIDPLAKIGKVGMIIRKILKKLRIVASATVFKMILRRMWIRLLGRVGLRAYVELISLPVFVIINMHEMRPSEFSNKCEQKLKSLEVGNSICSDEAKPAYVFWYFLLLAFITCCQAQV